MFSPDTMVDDQPTCAARFEATRTDPGYHCETAVTDYGDYCSRHEPADDENPWADD